jgi:hypothetical protein
MIIAPGERILLAKDEQALGSRFPGIPPAVRILEWDNGSLANEGEKLTLSMPGDQEWQKDRYWIRADQVNYEDKFPWPAAADGTGMSLTHRRPTEIENNYTNDPIHWRAATPGPGI